MSEHAQAAGHGGAPPLPADICPASHATAYRVRTQAGTMIQAPIHTTTGHTFRYIRHIGTKVIAYNPRRRCARKRVGVSDLVPVSSWGDEDTIEQGPGVWIVRGEDEEERP